MTTSVNSLTASMLGNRETIRQNTSRGEEIVKIELSKIVIDPEFNVREDYGDTEGMAKSLLENGQQQLGRVDVLANGTFLLIDGHRRYRGMKLLEDQGHEPLFKAIVNSSKTTLEDRLFQMFITQDNKQLAPHEVAEIITRLINMGHTQSTIAKKIGRTDTYVSQMVAFSKESPAVKEMVKNGEISSTAVRILQKKIPEQAARTEAIVKAISDHKSDDKTNAKSVSVAKVTGKKSKEDNSDKIAELAEKILEQYKIEGIDELIKLQLLIGEYFS